MQRRFGLDCINYLGDAATVARPADASALEEDEPSREAIDRRVWEKQAIEEMIRRKKQELLDLTRNLHNLGDIQA